jgi:hypothetical protein
MQALPEDTAAITEAATQGEAASDAAKARSAKADATKVLKALAEADLLHQASSDLADNPLAGGAAALVAAATAYACARTEEDRRKLTVGA